MWNERTMRAHCSRTKARLKPHKEGITEIKWCEQSVSAPWLLLPGGGGGGGGGTRCTVHGAPKQTEGSCFALSVSILHHQRSHPHSCSSSAGQHKHCGGRTVSPACLGPSSLCCRQTAEHCGRTNLQSPIRRRRKGRDMNPSSASRQRS